MFDARRPMGWLFLLLPVLVALTVSAQTIPTTMIVDTVYRADGTPAGGTLLISWPEFTTAADGVVAAGNTGVTLGTGGALSVGLVANANATPANTVYTVVYQLDDGSVKTEYWVVPTASPTTISAIRTTLGATSSASQMATQQYVNTALAGKANDAAVVHLAGSETIVGAKQFTVAPGLPTPVNPGDAANKEYVDNSVQNGGSGSYVSTAGGTMTGPLTLSGSPVAPGQAATKSYVDLGTAGKADLIAGLVPSGEMGTGTANNTVCLHGDSTWGGCGSSSNAVSIQNVPVATTLPTNNQVMTYNASLGEYAPEAGGGVTAGMAAVKYATDFAWSQSPATNLGTAGPQTVNLAACPAGVTGTEPWYYVYISATGTAEAVLVTGGTCAGNGQAGTLQFTTLNAHPAGYTISSASGGLQEALIVARFNPTNPVGPSQSGKVIVPPGELQAYARISIRASNVTVDFSGSIVDCYMNDTCILAGDSSNATEFLDITLVNPRGRPMVVSGQNPFIEVNAQKTRLLNVTTRIPPTGGTFSSYVQVDNDQSFLLDGLDTSLATGSSDYGVLCNASVCNPVIYAPGPFSSNAAVGWLKNLNISMQCAGNGIDWQSGNTVKISDSVIQGFAQYGVRAGIQRGGYGGFELDNVYEEVGSCTNPAGAIGEAGVIAQGATVKVEGAMLPAGSVPLYTNTGSIDYRYYIVANSASYGASNPLYAGRALTSGSGNITVTTPDVAGASTFDLLRVTYLATDDPREQAPYGNGNYAVATSVNRSSVCANGVCTFTDTQATLQAYTVATPAYFPLLEFWPGSLILAANVDSGSVLNAATAWVQSAPSDIVGVQGMGAPAVISTSCNALLGWTPLWLSCYTSMAPGTFYDQGALLMAVKPNNDGGLLTNLKGRLNFPTLGTAPGHIITLSDSNFQKTIATANNRPSNDANDAFIGYDQGNGNPATVGISLGAPVSISNYIGNVGDGTNWLERLTPGLKEFKTNVQLDNTLTVAGTAQASSFLTTGAGSWAVEGSYGALSPALAGKSAIGFGTGGQLQVSENGGAVVGVAVLDSNGMVSENANTATQLAQTPTQCNGSFVTGVQANGNANCSVADVVELAETGPPNGIPNYGIFWFDSTCHCPKVISNNGQPVQLGLLNVFNLDANTLEEYNGANPQTLNVYGTRTDASDYERMRLGYDTTDGYFFVGSDALGTNDPQQGLGLWLQGSLRWVVDTSFNFKPWSDNVKDIGSPTLRLKHLYTGTYVDTTVGAVATDLPNAPTSGTTLNKLAKVTGSPATAIIAATSDTGGMIGIVVDGAGTTGSAQIARGGQASCVFDGATTAGDYVQISSTAAGDCHDSGASYPGIGQVLGRVLSTNASTGTYAMLVAGAEVQAPSAGNVNTVFGRAGTIVAQAGDYSVGQVTGAAALASPALTGTPTAPTQATGDNSTAIATDAWVKAQGYGTGGGPPLGAPAQIPVMNAGASAYAPVTVSGDSTLTSLGVMTNGKINGIAVSGTPAIGYVPTATSTSAATWQAAAAATMVDSRSDTGALKTNPCGRIQDLSTNSTMINAQADQSGLIWPCGAIDFDPLNPTSKSTVIFGSGNGTVGSVYSTDLGFHLGAFDIFQGNATTLVTGGSPSPPPSGTVFVASSAFPGNTFTMTKVTGTTATLFSGSATSDTVLIGPGTRFILTGGTDHTEYRITECNINGAPCYLASNLVQSQCTGSACYSQFYSLAPSSNITISFVPTLNSSPSATAVTLLAPIVTIGDATGVNTASQSSCGNCNAALTGSQVKDIAVAGGTANAACIGGMNLFGQENTFFQDLYITDCAIGLIIEGPGGGGASTVNSGPHSRININFDGSFAAKWGTTQPVVPMEIDGGSEEVDRVTINAVNVGAAAQLSFGDLHITNAPGSSYGHGGAINIHDLHTEGCDNTVCGSSTIASGMQDGILIDSANGGGSITGMVTITNFNTCPGTHSCVNAVHVASNFAGVLNLSGVSCGTGTTNVIQDDINSNAMTCAHNTNGSGYYRLDGAGTAWTNFNCADMTKGWCEYNGVWGYYAGGSATVSTTSSTATQKAAVFNATTGFQINGAAPNTHCLVGNGTDYVDNTCPSGAAWGAITGTLSAQTDLQNALNLKAPLASPAFTGTPTAPTQSPGDSSTDIATDAFVATSFAPLASPSFTGTPVVPGYAKTGTLVSGNYASATGAGTVGNSSVVAGPYAIGWMTELTGGNNGVLPSSSANKAMMWGVTLTYPLSTSQVTYDIGSNADNTSTNNYDLGLFNSGGTLVLNLNSGTLHGSSFAPATGAVALSWAQGAKTLQPGDYYLMYYTSNTTATPPTLVSPSATAFTFYKGEAGGSGTCGTTQGSGGFAITPAAGGALPTSITPPANSYSWGACVPAIWIH